MKNLSGLLSFNNAETCRFFWHICFPFLERLYVFFKRASVEIDIELFYLAYLGVVERADVFDGFS